MEERTLTQIVQDHRSLEEILMDCDGEVSQSDQEAIVTAWMTEIMSNLTEKADKYKFKMDALEDAADRLDAHAKKIAATAKALSNVASGLKERMKFSMLDLGLKEVAGKNFRFKLSESKPSVIVNENDLPATYMAEKVTHQPDKDKIREHLEKGIVIPGAVLKINYSIRVSANKEKK